jgi:nucleoside-diphosphate-sugar epimerase
LGENKQMKALITGGAGFIGTNLVKRLLKDEHEVVSLDNYSTGLTENEQEGCVYHNVDIRDAVDFDFFMEKPDVIFHLAALPRIQPSFEAPAITFEANVLGTMNILEWARKNNTPVVYAGSSSVHSGHYMNPYTFTKWQGEELCKMYSEIYDLPTSICRFYNVYGPHHLTGGEYCTVIGIFEKQYENREALTVTGDGEQKRDFTHVDDIVDGLMRCSEHFTFKGEIFELGYGDNFSINVIADSFDGDKKYIDARPGEACDTLCSDKKAHELLGWKPTRNILDYIEDFKNEIDFIHNTLPK